MPIFIILSLVHLYICVFVYLYLWMGKKILFGPTGGAHLHNSQFGAFIYLCICIFVFVDGQEDIIWTNRRRAAAKSS